MLRVWQLLLPLLCWDGGYYPLHCCAEHDRSAAFRSGNISSSSHIV